MKLGFYYHVPAEMKGGALYMPGYQGCFIDSLARECEQVVCFLHSPDPGEQIALDYRITAKNVTWVDLGARGSALNRTLLSSKFTRLVQAHGARLDILLVRGPSPLLPALASDSPVPVALLLVGDYTRGVSDSPQPAWRKQLVRAWSNWNKWAQDRAAGHSLTFVNSRVLFDELKHRAPDLVETRTTTLSADSFFERADTCGGRPVRLLFVGRLDRAKGLLEMVKAVSLLIQQGEDVRLDLVGWPEKGDPILQEIDQLAKQLALSKKVAYLGSKSLGAPLNACYRTADIYVTASYSSEGFPRTIWEAMANSLPVVATRVGSIPAFVEGSAVLVQPGDPAALAQGISEVIHNEDLRRRHIQRGYALALENTLETQTHAMVERMKTWLEGKHGSPG